jgi:hypothetical protein
LVMELNLGHAGYWREGSEKALPRYDEDEE